MASNQSTSAGAATRGFRSADSIGFFGATPATKPTATSKAAGYMYLQNIVAAGTTNAATQLDIEGATGGETMSTPVQPDVPRAITITVTDSGAEVTDFQIDVVGTAPDGTAATEQFTRVADVGALVQVGSVVFAKLTSITLTSITETAGTAKTLDAGWNVKLGVPIPADSTGLSIVKLVSAGSEEAASATDTTNNSFTPTTAPDGAKDYEVWYAYTDAVKAGLVTLGLVSG